MAHRPRSEDRPQNQHFAAALRRLMAEKYVTNRKIAFYLRDYGIWVEEMSVADWKNGNEIPTRWDRVIPLLARLFRVDPVELICEVDEIGVAK